MASEALRTNGLPQPARGGLTRWHPGSSGKPERLLDAGGLRARTAARPRVVCRFDRWTVLCGKSSDLPMSDSSGARSVLAGSGWLSGYQSTWMRADVVAGLTLAAYLLPAAIGDASLAGLAPQAGLYACLFSGVVFWLFCSSRQTVVTVTSALSLLIGASIGE